MHVALVGAEIEENLGLRYLASALAARGHTSEVIAFDDPADIAGVAERIACGRYDVVGLSMMFQLRAREFVVLAERIRMRGWRGTLVAGGQHATFMADEVLADNPAIDAIVLGDGEAPLCELVDALPSMDVPGLVVRTATGIVHTAHRHDRTDLSTLPSPVRDPSPRIHMGVASAPMIASRGCYASCSFCSIAAWEKLSGGARYRVRPPELIAREMAALYHERGVRVFNFHDDNFWFPKVEANRERLAALDRALRTEGVHDIALLFKCRPPDVDRELFAQAKAMGMVRIYVGIETDAPAGLITLRRGVAQPQNQRALDILTELDVHATSNLLLFDPDTRLADIAHNIDFVERNARHTLNYCRVEPYGGTPLTRRLREEGRLTGDYLGFDYSLREPRVELMWRMAHVIIHDRNFPGDGLANEMIALAYRFHLAKRFWPSSTLEGLRAPVNDLVTRFNLDQVRVLRRLFEFVDTHDPEDRDAVHELTHTLAVEVRSADARFRAELVTLAAALERYAGGTSTGRLGEGAAGSGWWHVGASLVALAACAHDPVDSQKRPSPTPSPSPTVAPISPSPSPSKCAGKPIETLVLDAEGTKLVTKAKPAKEDRTTGELEVKSNGVTAKVGLGQLYAPNAGGCGPTPFLGYMVGVAINTSDYELVGISGGPALQATSITHGEHDEWVNFHVGNPGAKKQRIGVIWRKRSDSSKFVVAADLPEDPTIAFEKERQRMPGCDPVAMPVVMNPPINTDRAVHIAFSQGAIQRQLGVLDLVTWLDPSVAGTRGTPKITSSLGIVIATGTVDSPERVPMHFDARCVDGRIVPGRTTIEVEWSVDDKGKAATFRGTLELEIRNDGVVQPVTQKSGFAPEFERLPLRRRYRGTIERNGFTLRANGPQNVEVHAARWYGDVVTTDDPLVVERAGGGPVICVMDVSDGLCIASFG